MREKFKDIYRIESTRLKGWDYTKPGKYFVTICTCNREEFFGEIVNYKMVLSDIGKIAKSEWLKTEKNRKNVKLDKYVIMPNHIHGIVIIENTNKPYPVGNVRNVRVETRRASSLQCPKTSSLQCKKPTSLQYKMAKISPKPNSLSSIIGSFKSAVTKTANRRDVACYVSTAANFVWQPRFYDHIIRNKESLNEIREYIRKNPENWNNDINNIKRGRK